MARSAKGFDGSLDLVVAHYREDLAWLRRVPDAFRRIVYSKSGDPPAPAGDRRLVLPNIGREAHTYLHHLAEGYDDLADLTVFAQGKPFDHAPDFHKILRALASGDLEIDGFQWFGLVIDEDDPDGKRLFQPWPGNTEGHPLPMRRLYPALWSDPLPARFVFLPGGQFAVRRHRAQVRDRAWYRLARELCGEIPDAAHCFERLWDRVFDCDGIPPAFRGQPRPLYLRPVRKLDLTWDDVPPLTWRSVPR